MRQTASRQTIEFESKTYRNLIPLASIHLKLLKLQTLTVHICLRIFLAEQIKPGLCSIIHMML